MSLICSIIINGTIYYEYYVIIIINDAIVIVSISILYLYYWTNALFHYRVYIESIQLIGYIDNNNQPSDT